MNAAGFRQEHSGKQIEQRGFADVTVTETNGNILTKKCKVFDGMFTDQQILDASLGERIIYQMHKAKITQREFAKRLGCSTDRIWAYTHNVTEEGHMDIALLKKMAYCLDLPEYYFCSDYQIFMDTNNVPALLKQLRATYGLSQRKFAVKVGIPLYSYKGYETGGTRLPVKYWQKIKDLF